MSANSSNEPEPRLGPYLKRPRGERNPPGKFVYRIHGKNRSVETQWASLCSSHQGNARRCYDHLARTPKEAPIDVGRVGQLTGDHFEGRGIWQYEVGGGARVWYKVDEERHVVTIVRASVGHPKETEPR